MALLSEGWAWSILNDQVLTSGLKEASVSHQVNLLDSPL